MSWGVEMPNQVYGTSPVKRKRRTNAELEAIDDAIVDVLEEEHPATVRSVFYRVMSMGVVPKTENGYRLTARRLLKLRRSGRVPYGWIADGTRYSVMAGTFSSAQEAIELVARTYRREVWSNQPSNVLVFTEKDALRAVIAPVTRRWDVQFGVLRGYASETFAYEIAQALDSYKTNYLYQLGDHDPSGVDAWRSFEERVRAFRPDVMAYFERIAVTPEQIEQMNLPTRPTKTKDSRAASFLGGSVEVDAIPPSKLRDLVESRILAHLDYDAYEEMRRIESAEQSKLAEVVRELSI